MEEDTRLISCAGDTGQSGGGVAAVRGMLTTDP